MKPRALGMAVWIILLGAAASAEIVPELDITRLTKQSDIVALGSVIAVSSKAESSVGTTVATRTSEATLQIDGYLKGSSDASRLVCTFDAAITVAPRYAVRPNEYRLFFLSGDKDNCRFADSHYHSLSAVPVAEPPRDTTPLDRVSSVLAAAIDSSTLTAEEKSLLVLDTRTLTRPRIAAALARAARDPDHSLSVNAAGALLMHGEGSGLPMVVAALLKEGPAVPSSVLDALREDLRGVRDPAAVPAVARLLNSDDARTRQSAAYVLRNSHSEQAIKPLVRALDDPDREVQYTAVIALAELTKDYSHGPGVDTFVRAPDEYVRYWKAWAAQRDRSR